ncbi:transporter [Bacteroidia bacterium]|nr:transporter [Bacteroidia bacterium]
MKRIISFWLLIGLGYGSAFAQISLEECREKAHENYPLIKKYGLIEQTKEYNLSNAKKAYLPQFQLNARATYQSEVTGLPISLPGVTIPEVKKDQYQATVEASQLLWDGGGIRAQQKMTQANAEVEKKQLEVELYAIEDRVNQLFFGILLFDAQLEQNRVMAGELERNRQTIAVYMENGIANQSDLDAVRVEQLRVKQTRTQLQVTRSAYLEMLAIMTGEKFSDDISLIKPTQPVIAGLTRNPLSRPELQLFTAQADLFDSQKDLIKSSYMPKLGLYLQGGYGRPGLNMLSDAFEPFYIGGIRLTWNFGALYTQKNDLRKIETNKNTVDMQRDLFLYNIRLTESRENKDIQRIRELMKDDDEIISLRESIRKSAEAKMANGTLTVTDLLQEISREDMARQTKAAHEIDLLLAIYNSLWVRGTR